MLVVKSSKKMIAIDCCRCQADDALNSGGEEKVTVLSVFERLIELFEVE